MTEAQRAYELHCAGKSDQQIALQLSADRSKGRPRVSLEQARALREEGSRALSQSMRSLIKLEEA